MSYWEIPKCHKTKNKEHDFIESDIAKYCKACGLIPIVKEFKPKKIKVSSYRQRLLEAYDSKCFYCGVQLTLEIPIPLGQLSMTVDHYIPISKGGSSLFINLRPACFPCNNAKGDLMPIEFYFNRGGKNYMMVNVDNQIPGDIWKYGDKRLEVVEVIGLGVLRCKDQDGVEQTIWITVSTRLS